MITTVEIKEFVLTLPRDRKNPVGKTSEGEASCLYNATDGSHCIVGEVLYHFGLGDRLEEFQPFSILRNRFTDQLSMGALSYLSTLQRKADDLNYDDTPKYTWGEVIEMVEVNNAT